MFLPLPEGLLVNLQESRELVIDLLQNLPAMFEGTTETGSALGAALQASYKLMVSIKGITLAFVQSKVNMAQVSYKLMVSIKGNLGICQIKSQYGAGLV